MNRIDRGDVQRGGWKWPWRGMGIASLLTLLSACAFDPGGYGYGYGGETNIGVGVDYYEPSGFDYGGWGPGYRSGPWRGGSRPFEGGGHESPHAYRSPNMSHGIPSIPSGPRGGGIGGGIGGGRGGGGRR